MSNTLPANPESAPVFSGTPPARANTDAVMPESDEAATSVTGTEPADTSSAPGMAVGQVRWYSGSRGAGVVETGGGDTDEDEREEMAFLPGSAQEYLGDVNEGDAVAIAKAGPAHVSMDENTGTSMFPLGLDKMMGGDEG